MLHSHCHTILSSCKTSNSDTPRFPCRPRYGPSAAVALPWLTTLTTSSWSWTTSNRTSSNPDHLCRHLCEGYPTAYLLALPGAEPYSPEPRYADCFNLSVRLRAFCCSPPHTHHSPKDCLQVSWRLHTLLYSSSHSFLRPSIVLTGCVCCLIQCLQTVNLGWRT